jgi:hypothetical protein
LGDGSKWVAKVDPYTNTVTTGWWLWKKTTSTTHTTIPTVGPNKDEIVTISHVRGDGYLHLMEYEQYGYYDPSFFRPFDNLEEALDRIQEEAKNDELVLQP